MQKITGFVLAGGESSRMGTDKGLLTLNGQTFAEILCGVLTPISGKNITIISSNPEYDFLGFQRIEDLVKGKGPVGGIHTALKTSLTELNFILSVDSPLISTELLLWILENHSKRFLISQVRDFQKEYPLIAVYDRFLKTVFEENIKNDQLCLQKIIKKESHQSILVPEKWTNQLQNINTKEDYQNIIQ